MVVTGQSGRLSPHVHVLLSAIYSRCAELQIQRIDHP